MRITLEKLEKYSNVNKRFSYYSNYPPVLRDLSVSVKRDVKAGDLIQKIWKSPVKGLLRKVELYDIYDFGRENSEKLSYTFELVFQSDDRTLTNDEINSLQQEIINNLKKTLNAELRN
jgi:phenylalanyl-tRNA synthetase beta chain